MRRKYHLTKGDPISKLKIAVIILIITIPLVSIAKAGHEAKQKLKKENTAIISVKKPEVVKTPTPEIKTPQIAPKQPTTQPIVTPTTQFAGNCFDSMRKYFPQSQWQTAQAVVRAESGGNPNSVSSTNDHGCFQIHAGLANYGQAIYNPDTNASIAFRMWSNRGWQPWSAYNSGSYKRFL